MSAASADRSKQRATRPMSLEGDHGAPEPRRPRHVLDDVAGGVWSDRRAGRLRHGLVAKRAYQIRAAYVASARVIVSIAERPKQDLAGCREAEDSGPIPG